VRVRFPLPALRNNLHAFGRAPIGPRYAIFDTTVRVAVVQLGPVAGIASPIAMIALGEPTAYAVMGGLSGVLLSPTGEDVVAAPHRLPAEDERVAAGQPPFTAAAYVRHGCPRSDGQAGRSSGVSFDVGTTDSTTFDALFPPRAISFST
jgi:hypothetical protein